MRFVDNVDWLHFSFESSQEYFSSERYRFSYVRSTGEFNNIYDIIDIATNTAVAELRTQPRKHLGKSHNFKIIQIKNRFLYTKEYKRYFLDFQDGFEFGDDYNISRVDFCRDFEKFYNNLSVQSFIDRVNKNEFVYKSKSKPLLKIKGKKSYEIHRFSYDFEIYKKMRKERTEYETLYIGSHKSSIAKTLYNKSLEQREKVRKPHIEELHNAVFGTNHSDIYRLEFSVKGGVLDLIKRETGEVGKLRIEDLDDVTGIIRYLISKKYKFLRYSEKKNKARDWEEVQLFTDEESAKYELKPIAKKSNSNQANKTFATKIALLPQSMRNNELFRSPVVRDVMNKLYSSYIDEYALEEYHRQKILPRIRGFYKSEVNKR